MSTDQEIAAALRSSGSSCRPGPSATPGRASRCSPSAASRATRTRRSRTRRRSTATPASRRRSRSTSRGTRSTTTPSSPGTPRRRASPSGRSTRTRSRTTTTCSAASATPLPASAARRSTTCSSASTSWTRPGHATSSCGSPTGPTTPARTTSGLARIASRRRSPPSTLGSVPTSGWSSSTSCSSRRSTRWTCPTGVPRSSSAWPSGPRRTVVVDTGHHAPGTNIEFIVASLLRAGKLGGFDFNSRFYADDDLMVGAADPFQLFRIMHEVVKATRCDPRPGSRSCSTSATTSSPRSPARSGR